MKATVTLSANAGVMLEYAGTKILVDIIHNDNVPTFSSVPLDLCRSIISDGAFSNADMLLISHDHPDHFSRTLVNDYLKNNKSTAAAAPFRFTERQFVFSGVSGKFRMKNFSMEYYKTPHEKRKVYSDSKHYSFVLTINDKRFLFFNDMSIEPDYIELLVKNNVKADAAFVNFPWFTLKYGRKYLKEYLNADNIIIYHLPIPNEDEFGYNAALTKTLGSFSIDGANIFVLNTPLQKAEFDL